MSISHVDLPINIGSYLLQLSLVMFNHVFLIKSNKIAKFLYSEEVELIKGQA